MSQKPNYGELAKKYAATLGTEKFAIARSGKIQHYEREKKVKEIHKNLIEALVDFDDLDLIGGIKVKAPTYRDMLMYALPGQANKILAIFTTEYKKEGTYDAKDKNQWYRCIAEFKYPIEHKIVARNVEQLMERTALYIGALM